MSLRPARTAVVPLAGLATRMQPLARTIPKEMLPLGDRPILHHVVDELADAGVDHVVLVVGKHAEPVLRYFDVVDDLDERLRKKGQDRAVSTVWNKALRCKFSYVEQRQARGVADAVAQARKLVGDEPYIVHMGDSVIPGGSGLLSRMQEAFLTQEADIVVGVGSRLAHPSGAEAVAEPESPDVPLDQPYPVRRILEHPPSDGRTLPLVIGRYLLRGPMMPWEGPSPGFGRVGGLGALLADQPSARVTAVPLEDDRVLLGGGTLEEYHASWRAWLAEPSSR